MRITTFDVGYQNLVPGNVVESWDEFVDLVSTVTEGQKNGPYFVRGECCGDRSDDNIKNISLIIIDGDQLLNAGSTCCPPNGVHDCLARHNITHVVYNSYSNNLYNNIHKWRACIPSSYVIDQATLTQAVDEIISLLHDDGLMVRNVKENHTLSQPWFLPRCPEGMVDDFYSAWHDGDEYKLTGYVVDSAKYGAAVSGEKINGGGCFSWDYVISQWQAGTLHMGLKSAAGWLNYTTDWADSQIEQHLTALVSAICPDKEKVERAKKGEIKKLVEFCRKKSGVIEHSANWKDHLISADELKDKAFPPIRWVVDHLIPEGFAVLAGDPKAGKSLMALDICNSVASGGLAFGTQNCQAGDVVYCSLEDPQRRVKERIKQQCDLWPATFHLVDGGIPQIGPDFFRILDEMVMIWPNLRCVVIDTMQFIIPPKPANVQDYDHYYRCLDPLHRWALDNRIGLICITHKTKAQKREGDNPFAGIIGSVAIQGTSDAMLMLSRNHAKGDIIDPKLADGFLDVAGREVGAAHYSLDFDSELMKWSLRGSVEGKKEGVDNMNWLLIIATLEKEKSLTPAQLSSCTKINLSTVKSCLLRMKSKSLVLSDDGKWSLLNAKFKPDVVIDEGFEW